VEIKWVYSGRRSGRIFSTTARKEGKERLLFTEKGQLPI